MSKILLFSRFKITYKIFFITILINFFITSVNKILFRTLLGALCCPVPWTFLLLTKIHQHFNTTKSPKILGQYSVCTAASVAKQSVVILVLGLLWCNTALALPKCPQPYSIKTWRNCNGAYQA